MSSHASAGLEAALVQVASVTSCRYQLLHRNCCSNGDGTGKVKALDLASAALATFQTWPKCLWGFFFLISSFLMDWIDYFSHLLDLMGGD